MIKIYKTLSFLFLLITSTSNQMHCSEISHVEDIERIYPNFFSKKAPFISYKPVGQLGNQLFQAATSISQALDLNCSFSYPNHGYKETYKEIFRNLPQIDPEPNFRLYYKMGLNYSPFPFKKGHKLNDNLKFRGLFYSYKYFHHNRDVITQLFSPSEEKKKEIYSKYSDIFREPVVVGLHIRTYIPDALKMNNSSEITQFYRRFHAPSISYIFNAMNYFKEDPLFVVCSDSMTWAKNALKSVRKRCVFIEDDCVNTLYLLSMCNHCIISNSSFSWWAAYLNMNENAIIVAPIPFTVNQREQIEDIYLPEWVMIPRGNDAVIPVDMLPIMKPRIKL